MLIEEDLGYCCPFRFFSLYPDNSLIAARLGVHVRTVQKHRERLVAGTLKCTCRSGCLLAKAVVSAPKP
jgi:hypothetical protein